MNITVYSPLEKWLWDSGWGLPVALIVTIISLAFIGWVASRVIRDHIEFDKKWAESEQRHKEHHDRLSGRRGKLPR